ncbi:MAG: type II toxin-antitoxin system VapC family toxin [Acidimicrobiaceae bacterium]|nr:type II toxin-antitoxin system VapC family toxin [Acidimicrobiaceae bacterium]MYC41778.1 type II toxin-antitoxin system VapC family toxin [Acidimicrobiaceae bacterium]MYH88198.1 type II toxin-antitoxin system VapC family toxin [Acidimicrobiaceae bacterium]
MKRPAVVVDASTLIAVVTGGTSVGNQARRRLQGCRRVAPFLVDAETGHAPRGLVLRGELAADTAAAARQRAERMIHSRVPHHGPLAARAWQLRHNLTFYDALYLALAESLDCPLVTADQRIERAHPSHELIQTIWTD